MNSKAVCYVYRLHPLAKGAGQRFASIKRGIAVVLDQLLPDSEWSSLGAYATAAGITEPVSVFSVLQCKNAKEVSAYQQFLTQDTKFPRAIAWVDKTN